MLDLAAHRRDRTVAFAMVLALLLQAFFTAWATGAAGAMAADAWGNPLCMTSSDDGASPDANDVKAADCCAMACGGAAGAVPAPEGNAEPFRAEPAGPVRAIAVDCAPLPSRGHASGSPRAPPSAV